MPKLSKEMRSLFSMDSEISVKSYGNQYSSRNDLKNEIERYVNADLTGEADWTRATEIPTEKEIGWIENGEVRTPDLNIDVARMDGSYDSKEEYLSTQHRLMRMDGAMPLARSVDDVRRGNLSPETNDYRVYDEIFITTVAIARDGFAFKIEFSGTSIGKIVRWAKSKRLRSGSLVALTPAHDKFKTKCIPAIIASRLLENLEVQAPLKPSIFVYIGDSAQIDIDPQKKWIMVECTQGYWEAYRHTLKALQKIRLESFPMQEYLVEMKTKVEGPAYRIKRPFMNVNFAAYTEHDELKNLNVLKEWPSFEEIGAPRKDPTKIPSVMDNSQIDALKRILTKKLAIVQGPPGTGKTFTSVAAIKILLDNMAPNDPPIIIAAQTNHAVDQILRHISKFEPEFIRLGGQTSDQDIIKPRTIYELKGTRKQPVSASTRRAGTIRKAIGNELANLLQPLQSDEPITAEMFLKFGILSEGQCDSINATESRWASDDSPNKMTLWCNGKLAKIINEDKVDAYAAQLEEEQENLDELELEAPDNEDDKFEQLPGRRFELCAGYKTSGRSSGIGDDEIARLLSKISNFQVIPDEHRPAIYDFLRRGLTQKITERLRTLGERCKEAGIIARIGRWESDYEIIRTSRVIGLTTTGLSKYRGFLSLLKPQVVLIEEAAETLEPYTAAAVFDTLEHLILVGDHQQLRANCSYDEMIGDPINFDVSLFERLVKNEVEFSRLNCQRRMRPEIRLLIKHIYPDLEDHSSVMDRADVGGLGASNVWFWHHESGESMDESKSKQNLAEARMVIEFTKYLVWNNIPLHKITILTFYNGQKKVILEDFHRQIMFKGYRLKVCTVDSYQGEENDVVLLSLVRNNHMNNIGFLSSINRACVALSRARVGFYIFGNAKILIRSDHWAKVIEELQAQDAVRKFLPLYCPDHDTMKSARDHTDLEGLNGGCDEGCKNILVCGHQCPLKCHPGRDCRAEDCEESCVKILECGHPCSSLCHENCICHHCSEEARKAATLYAKQDGTSFGQPITRSSGANHSIGLRIAASQDQSYPETPTPAGAAQRTARWSEFAKSEYRSTSPLKSKGLSTSRTLKQVITQHDPQILANGRPSATSVSGTRTFDESNQKQDQRNKSSAGNTRRTNKADSNTNGDIQMLVDYTEYVALGPTTPTGRKVRTSTYTYHQDSLI